MIEKSNKGYQLVDIFKLLFAVFIFLLHSGVFIGTDLFAKIFIRLGVPFFFIASGFFFNEKIKKAELSHEVLKNYSVRLIKMLLIFEPLSLLYNVFDYFVKGYGVSVVLLKTIQSIIFYPPGALWYIQALIIALILLYPFIKSKKEIFIIPVGTVLYCFSLICNNYYFVVYGTRFQHIVDKYMKIAISARNGLFVGFLFVGIGIIISKYRVREVTSAQKSKSAAGFAVSFVLFVSEVLLINGKKFVDDSGFFVLLPLVSALLFINCLNYRLSCGTKLIRNLSTSIYLLHKPALQLTAITFYIINKFVIFKSNVYISFCIAMVLLVLFILWVYIKKPEKVYRYII